MYQPEFNLAIFLDQKIEAGGGYQQAFNSLLITSSLKNEIFKIKVFSIIKNDVKKLKKLNINAEYLEINFFIKLITLIKINPKFKFLYHLVSPFININPLEKFFRRKNIDLVYFISPSRYAICIGNLNYIYTIWDICHRDNPEFPEVRIRQEFEIREFIYYNVLPKATGIVVDSAQSKLKLSKIYNLDPEKIIIIPFEPAPLIKNFDRTLKKNNYPKLNKILKSPYIFYPAQFWSHKNHVYILEGISILKKNYGIKINAVFTGSDKGNLSYVKKYAKHLNLLDQINFLGFVSDELMLDIYLNSFALVMPTYFGPTNLPPLEAFKLGVPVFYSDNKEMREEVGESAIFMDLSNPNSLAEQLKNLKENKQLRKKLIKSGNKKYKEIKNFERSKELSNLIRKFFQKRKCWE